MSTIPTNTSQDRLVVPETLKGQLTAFRDRVWTSKMLESMALGLVGVLLAFLTVYVVDRFVDTPQVARMGIFLVSLAIWLAVPWALHRWVWRHRRLEQLARLLRVREPSVGDQLLSVIELAGDDSEQARSRRSVRRRSNKSPCLPREETSKSPPLLPDSEAWWSCCRRLAWPPACWRHCFRRQ